MNGETSKNDIYTRNHAIDDIWFSKLNAHDQDMYLESVKDFITISLMETLKHVLSDGESRIVKLGDFRMVTGADFNMSELRQQLKVNDLVHCNECMYYNRPSCPLGNNAIFFDPIKFYCAAGIRKDREEAKGETDE